MKKHNTSPTSKEQDKAIAELPKIGSERLRQDQRASETGTLEVELLNLQAHSSISHEPFSPNPIIH